MTIVDFLSRCSLDTVCTTEQTSGHGRNNAWSFGWGKWENQFFEWWKAFYHLHLNRNVRSLSLFDNLWYKCMNPGIGYGQWAVAKPDATRPPTQGQVLYRHTLAVCLCSQLIKLRLKWDNQLECGRWLWRSLVAEATRTRPFYSPQN